MNRVPTYTGVLFDCEFFLRLQKGLTEDMPSLRQQVDDLQDVLDQVESTLEVAYQPESSREDLAAAVGEALTIISPDVEEEDETDDDNGADAED